MQEINLYDLIKYYAKKWRIITTFTIAGLLAGVIYNSFIQVPLYRSETKLIIATEAGGQTQSDPMLINNYIDLIKSHRVLDPVIEKGRNSLSYDQLSKYVQATNKKDTAVINIVVSTPNAEQSKLIANDTTSSFKTAVSDLYRKDNVAVVDPAVEASTPINTHKTKQLIYSALGSLLLSLIVLFCVYDYKHRNDQEVALKTKKSSNKIRQQTKDKSAKKSKSTKK